MALFKYQCVYFGLQGAGYTRQTRNPSTYSGFFPLSSTKNDPGTNHLQPNTAFSLPLALYPDAQIMQGGATYDFSFINISGFTTGGATSFNISSPPTGTVSTDPGATLQVLVVYIQQGGPGPGGAPGAVIDSFDETVGSLFNNYFVNVSPDSGGARTNSANVYGYVDTSSQEAAISAYGSINPVIPSSILPPNVNFEQWHVLSGPASSAVGDTLTVAARQTEYALAFYSTPIFKKPLKEFKELKEIEKFYIKDFKEPIYEGPWKLIGDNIPIDPGGPVEIIGELARINEAIQQLSTEVAEIKGQSFIRNTDRPDVGKNIAGGEANG